MTKSFLNNILFNGVGEFGSRLPFIFTEIVIAKTLGPVNYAIWAIIQIVISYNNFSHFGLLSGLAKLEPINLGKKNNHKVSLLRSNSFYPVFFLDALVLIAVLIFTFVDIPILQIFSANLGISPDVIVWMAVLIVIQQMFLYIQVRLQNIMQFKILMYMKLSYALFFMCLVFWGQHHLTIELLVKYLLVSLGLVSFYVLLLKKVLPSWSFKASIIKEMFLVGFPVFVVGLIKLFLISLDKILIALYLSKEQLAYYSISFQAMIVASMLVGLISRVFSPIFLKETGKESNNELIFYQSVKSLSMIVGVLLSIFGAFLFQEIVIKFLPDYKEGILAGIVLIFSGLYQGVVQFSITAIIARNKEYKMLFLFLVILLPYLSIMYFVIQFSGDILHVALVNLFFWISLEVILIRVFLNEKASVELILIFMSSLFFAVYFSEYDNFIDRLLYSLFLLVLVSFISLRLFKQFIDLYHRISSN